MKIMAYWWLYTYPHIAWSKFASNAKEYSGLHDYLKRHDRYSLSVVKQNLHARTLCMPSTAAMHKLNNYVWILESPSGRTESVITTFLVLTQPRLAGFSEHSLCSIVHEVPANDQYKCNRVQPVYMQVE